MRAAALSRRTDLTERRAENSLSYIILQNSSNYQKVGRLKRTRVNYMDQTMEKDKRVNYTDQTLGNLYNITRTS